MIHYSVLTKEDKNNLKKMLQLYLHDISRFFPIDFDSEKCEYIYDDIDDYFDNGEKAAIVFFNEDDIIGFSLVDKNEEEYIVQEMFILNNYKNKGYGEECIRKVFDDFRGKWVIRSLPCSEKSENFWNKTIKNYTNDSFELERVGKYNRAVFRFNNLEK